MLVLATRLSGAMACKRYEQWEIVDGKARLTEGMLFPPRRKITQISRPGKRNPGIVANHIKTILKRCGITGPQAHCHAFRKGVVTELLRAGNPLKTVSLFVHHKNTYVTEKSYDKRQREELLEKMVAPLGWESLVEDVNGPVWLQFWSGWFPHRPRRDASRGKSGC